MPKTKRSGANMTQATHPDHLRLERLKRGMTQRALADELSRKYKIKVASSQIHRVEHNVTQYPAPPLRQALCDYFGLPLTFFKDYPPH